MPMTNRFWSSIVQFRKQMATGFSFDALTLQCVICSNVHLGPMVKFILNDQHKHIRNANREQTEQVATETTLSRIAIQQCWLGQCDVLCYTYCMASIYIISCRCKKNDRSIENFVRNCTAKIEFNLNHFDFMLLREKHFSLITPNHEI